MTDIHLDDDIPVVVERIVEVPKKDISWLTLILLATCFTMLGVMAGWFHGYLTGINQATEIIEAVFNEIEDNIITKGEMPW